jgi:hypothetical protein
MAGEPLFIGWGAVVRGREKQALKVFQESMEYYGKLQQDGRIEGFDVLLLAPHGGDLNGFVILRGDRKALATSGSAMSSSGSPPVRRRTSIRLASSRPTAARRWRSKWSSKRSQTSSADSGFLVAVIAAGVGRSVQR